jgi:hypothetical protein
MFATAGNSSDFGPRCYPRLLLRGDAESDARFTHMKAVGHRYEKWGFHQKSNPHKDLRPPTASCDLQQKRP